MLTGDVSGASGGYSLTTHPVVCRRRVLRYTFSLGYFFFLVLWLKYSPLPIFPLYKTIFQLKFEQALFFLFFSSSPPLFFFFLMKYELFFLMNMSFIFSLPSQKNSSQVPRHYMEPRLCSLPMDLNHPATPLSALHVL